MQSLVFSLMVLRKMALIQWCVVCSVQKFPHKRHSAKVRTAHDLLNPHKDMHDASSLGSIHWLPSPSSSSKQIKLLIPLSRNDYMFPEALQWSAWTFNSAWWGLLIPDVPGFERSSLGFLRHPLGCSKTSNPLQGQRAKWAAVCVHTDTASKKPRQLCSGVFSNLSWHTGDGFDFTTTAQALLTLKAQQFNTKWLRSKQRITSGYWFSPWPSLLLSVTQPWSTFDGNWVSWRGRWCQTCHAAGSPESNSVSISVCDLALI